ncbi:hypothetical protein [Thalassiella azotivora]
MRPTVVYVHGNGNKPPEDRLKRQWDESLFGRPMGEATRVAYWAPLLHPQPLGEAEAGSLADTGVDVGTGPRAAALDPLTAQPHESAAVVPPPEAFLAEVAAEVGDPALAAAPGASDGPLESAAGSAPLAGWLSDLTFAAEALAEGENAAPPPSSPFEALPLPRAARTLAFRALVKVTFKDVHAYFFGGMKEKMRQVLRDTLTAVDGPVVVIGHSLGSVLAYDVLSEPDAAGRDVPLLLTVGSPLGVTEVQDLVERPLRVPAGVRAWRNVCDARDLVALDHTIRPEYRPGDRCTDYLVTNDSANHHGIREYLRTLPVRRPVLELVREVP